MRGPRRPALGRPGHPGGARVPGRPRSSDWPVQVLAAARSDEPAARRSGALHRPPASQVVALSTGSSRDDATSLAARGARRRSRAGRRRARRRGRRRAPAAGRGAGRRASPTPARSTSGTGAGRRPARCRAASRTRSPDRGGAGSAALPPERREVLRTAALLGRDLPWELLSAVTDAATEAVTAALRRRRRRAPARRRPGGRTAAVAARADPGRRACRPYRPGAGGARRPRGDGARRRRPAGARLARVAELHARGGSPWPCGRASAASRRASTGRLVRCGRAVVLERAVALAGEHRPRGSRIADRTGRDARPRRADRRRPCWSGTPAAATTAARPYGAGSRPWPVPASPPSGSPRPRRHLARDGPRGPAGTRPVRACGARRGRGRRGTATGRRGSRRSRTGDGAPEAVCEALEVVGAAVAAPTRSAPGRASARAERLAARHGLDPWRIRALSELGVTDLFGTGDGGPASGRGSSLECGLLGTADMLELQRPHCQRCGGRGRREDPAGRCAERARAWVWPDNGHSADVRGPWPGLRRPRRGARRTCSTRREALAREPAAPARRALPSAPVDPWLCGDPRRRAPTDAAVDLLRGAAGSNPAPDMGRVGVLRTALDPADPAPREELRSSDVLVQAINARRCTAADARGRGAGGRRRRRGPAPRPPPTTCSASGPSSATCSARSWSRRPATPVRRPGPASCTRRWPGSPAPTRCG